MAKSSPNHYVSDGYANLNLVAKNSRKEYAAGTPFPHIIIDNFFDQEILGQIADSFPDLSKNSLSTKFNNKAEIKLASARGDEQQSEPIKQFLRYLNSSPFIDFLQQLTSINEYLIPDSHFLGGGLHQIKPGGLLKIHADFPRHNETGLDRRINVLIYLNRDWEEDYGGHLQLWDKDVKVCLKKILPIYNRIVIFNTTDFTYHGHPDPLTCPPHRSRKSLALYYYSNGRPEQELRPTHWSQSTLFKERPGEDFLSQTAAQRAKAIARNLLPPIIYSAPKKLRAILRK